MIYLLNLYKFELIITCMRKKDFATCQHFSSDDGIDARNARKASIADYTQHRWPVARRMTSDDFGHVLQDYEEVALIPRNSAKIGLLNVSS